MSDEEVKSLAQKINALEDRLSEFRVTFWRGIAIMACTFVISVAGAAVYFGGIIKDVDENTKSRDVVALHNAEIAAMKAVLTRVGAALDDVNAYLRANRR